MDVLEKTKFSSLTRTRKPDVPVVSLVTIPTRNITQFISWQENKQNSPLAMNVSDWT
jgi:hypothetical protein